MECRSSHEDLHCEKQGSDKGHEHEDGMKQGAQTGGGTGEVQCTVSQTAGL
jgi:hypothetical protein